MRIETNIQISTISAYDWVYQYGYDNKQAQYGTMLNSRTFFETLRNKIVEEYKNYGRCELIDSLLERNDYIDIVVYAAIIDAQRGLAGHQMYNATTYAKSVPYVTYQIKTRLGTRIAYWDDCTYINEHKQYTSFRIQNLLLNVRNSGKATYEALQHKRSPSDVKNDYEMKQETQSDQHQGQEELDSAWAKAAQIIEQAQRRAKEIEESAQAEKEQIIADAEAEARRRAREIEKAAQAEKERIVADAEAEATEIRAASSRTVESGPAEQALKTPVKQYFAQDWEEIRQSYEKELSAMRQENQEVSAEIERVHDRMVSDTNEIQRQITTSISSAVEDMSNMREELYKKLREWQTSLFRREYKPLAQRYVELYRIINFNVKRLLADEASFQCAQPDGISRFSSSGEAYSVADTSALSGQDTAPSTLAGLQKLHKTLMIFLQKFEASMKGVGLYVFFPEEGTVFDEVQHMVENDDIDPEGRTIIRCIVPGVAKKAIDAEEDDIVVCATVEL